MGQSGGSWRRPAENYCFALPAALRSAVKHGQWQKVRGKRQKQQRWNFLGKWAGYSLNHQTRNTVIINELNISSLNNGIQNNKPEGVPKQLLDYTLRGYARSYAGRINSSRRAAIFNRCAATSPQVCSGSLGGRSERSEKKSSNKKIVEVYFRSTVYFS
jgi:hypothetical protein